MKFYCQYSVPIFTISISNNIDIHKNGSDSSLNQRCFFLSISNVHHVPFMTKLGRLLKTNFDN